MKYLYKYPQARVPLRPARRREPRRDGQRTRSTSCSTPASSTSDRYFDIFVEYAKADPDDICIRIEAFNRGPEAAAAPRAAAPVVPQHLGLGRPPRPGAAIRPGPNGRASSASSPTTRRRAARRIPLRLPPRARAPLRPRGRRAALHRQRDERRRASRRRRGEPQPLRQGRLPPPHHPRRGLRQPGADGTKACLHYRRAGAGRAARRSSRLRLRRTRWPRRSASVDAIVAPAQAEADEFYEAHPPAEGDGRTSSWCSGRRWPACSGRKQIYLFDVERLAEGDDPRCRRRPARARSATRTGGISTRCAILSMPDKWEYPWFAAWDLAFHCVAAGAGRSGVRQGAALAAAVRAVPAPQRPDPGLRVGVLRPQPAGARVGRAGASTTWSGSARGQGATASSWRSASTSC